MFPLKEQEDENLKKITTTTKIKPCKATLKLKGPLKSCFRTKLHKVGSRKRTARNSQPQWSQKPNWLMCFGGCDWAHQFFKRTCSPNLAFFLCNDGDSWYGAVCSAGETQHSQHSSQDISQSAELKFPFLSGTKVCTLHLNTKYRKIVHFRVWNTKFLCDYHSNSS